MIPQQQIEAEGWKRDYGRACRDAHGNRKAYEREHARAEELEKLRKQDRDLMNGMARLLGSAIEMLGLQSVEELHHVEMCVFSAHGCQVFSDFDGRPQWCPDFLAKFRSGLIRPDRTTAVGEYMREIAEELAG